MRGSLDVRRPLGLRTVPAPRLDDADRLRDCHVLLVGINFAPEPTGIAPYTTAMARHLARTTRRVTVLTGVPHYPSWTVPYEYRRVLRRSERVVGVPDLRVQRLRHLVPHRQNGVTRSAYEASFLLNAFAVRPPRDTDVVIAVTPSLGGAFAAGALAERVGAPLLVIVQDLVARAAVQSGMKGGRLAAGPASRIEGHALRRATRVALVSEAFRGQALAHGVDPARIGLLPNWTHIEPSDATTARARAHLGWPREPFTVVHTGNIGLKQDLTNVVDAARLLDGGPDVRFVIVGDGSQRDAVRARAAGLTNVAFVDPLDDDTYPLALAAADVLLVNERPQVGDMSLPSKLTSYFCAGRPVLAAVADGGATAQELETTGGAAVRVPAGSPAALADAVQRLLDDPERCATLAAAGARYARENLTFEAAMRRLDEHLALCLEAR